MTDKTKDKPLIKCADCKHCAQYREVAPGTGRYVIKVKCTKGHWQPGRKRGATDLHRVMVRRKTKCADYISMSETEAERLQYLHDLALDLPMEQIVYEPSGEPVDILEVPSWQEAM